MTFGSALAVGPNDPDAETAFAPEPGPEAQPDAEDLPPALFRRPAEVLSEIKLPKARLSSGFPSIDKASRGGLPTGSLLVIQGGPDAGKTGVALQIAVHIGTSIQEEQGSVAFFYTPDSGREVTALRIGAILGFSIDRLEQRDPQELELFNRCLSDRGVFIFDDSLEGMSLERAIDEAEKVEPELPHVLITDSIQEALPAEDSGEQTERERVIANVRLLRRAKASRVPWILIATSEIVKSAFSSKKSADNSHPIAAGAESAKIGYAANMVLHLSGDPAEAPDFGLARVAKNKLGGPKLSFGLRLDPVTLKLAELDRESVDLARAERDQLERNTAIAGLGTRAFTLLTQSGPINVSEIREALACKRELLIVALANLERDGKVFWKLGERKAKVYGVTAPVPLTLEESQS